MFLIIANHNTGGPPHRSAASTAPRVQLQVCLQWLRADPGELDALRPELPAAQADGPAEAHPD